MSFAVDRPVSIPETLPRELEDFIDESIERMSPKQLRKWQRESEKIMRASKNRSGEQPAARRIAG